MVILGVENLGTPFLGMLIMRLVISGIVILGLVVLERVRRRFFLNWKSCRVTSGENTPAFIIWQKEDKVNINVTIIITIFALHRKLSDGSKYFSQIRIRYWQIALQDRIVQRTLIPSLPSDPSLKCMSIPSLSESRTTPSLIGVSLSSSAQHHHP